MHIWANKTDENLYPPKLIFVGQGEVLTIAAAAINQAQYGGDYAGPNTFGNAIL